MTERFLKARHWQLFLLIFGIPFVLQMILMAAMMTSIISAQGAPPDPQVFFNYMKFFPLIGIISMGAFFGWFWSIGTGLQRFVPPEVKLNVKLFKVFLFTPVAYILFIMIFFAYVISAGGLNPAVIAVILPLHLFSIFCIFYCLYFVAKTFKTAELQRAVTFGDFAGEFFLVWFYPIGVWIIQPKINKMVQEKQTLN